MARARNIKPALFKNEILGVADPLYTLLFESLWLLADRAGRLEDRPLRIKAETFPYREGINMDALLGWLADNGFIIRYQHGENRYIQIVNFEKHQNPHKNEPPSEIPEYSKGCIDSSKFGTTSEKIGSAPADSLSTDSLNLIPDSPTTDSPPSGDGEKSGQPKSGNEKPAKYMTANDLARSFNVVQQIADDFIAIRKAKRSPLTQTALDGIKREAEKAGITLEDALRVCIERGWQGFKADWYQNQGSPKQPTGRRMPAPDDFDNKEYESGLL